MVDMATIKSLSESFGVLKRNLVVFAVGLLYAVIILPQTAASLFGIPIIPRVLQFLTFFITPFILAGLLGMTYEGRVRDTSFGTFTKIGKAKYVSLLAGNLIQLLINVVFAVVGFVALLFTVGLGVSAAQGGSDVGSSVLSGIGVVAIALFGGLVLVYLLVMFFLQFFAPAIVADNVGVVDGYKRSMGVVKRNIVQTLGFGVLNLLVSILLLLPAIGVVLLTFVGTSGLESAGISGADSAAQTAGSGDLPILALVGVLGYSFITTTLVTPFRAAFSVSFYDNHRPSDWD